ncbi:MAG: cysteine-rich repeat protein, partial [Hyphomicrobiaceae bacterium]
SVTTSSVTTSTIAPVHCQVEVSVLGTEPLTALQWHLDYDPALGDFLGVGSAVQCEILLAGTLTSINDRDVAARLEAAHIALDPFHSPSPLVRCAWAGSSVPSGADFPIAVEVASNEAGEELDPPPGVAITKLDCSSSVTTTTIPFCGDGVVQADEDCDDANADNSDACLDGCIAAACGDGIERLSVEECDDGNTDDGDGCSSGCSVSRLCGDADDSGRILATDALLVLRSAVGQDIRCPAFVCDVNGNGAITASDALATLRLAVFMRTGTTCPAVGAVILSVETDQPLQSLELQWFDSGNAGRFGGLPGAPECSLLVEGELSAEPLIDGVGLAVILDQAPAGSTDIVRCGFTPRDTVGDDDFAIDLIEALDSEGTAVIPQPTLESRAD